MSTRSSCPIIPSQLAPDIAKIVTLVHQRTGLTFPPNRMFIVEAGVRRAMRGAGIRDSTAYTQQLSTDVELMDDLFAELTVGETYFFRDPGQLDVIRDHVLPDLSQALTASAGLRIWSAGCATGEEPYTLAMMLADAGLAEHAYLIGTDISRERLYVAQRGWYRKWSMRGVDPRIIARHFTTHGERFEVSPAIRKMVEFRYLNLGLDQYPSPALGVWAMDLILCRNVLIYFDEQTVAMVARRLLDSLSLKGWLFLGASDPLISDLVRCEVVTTPAGLAYRRRRAGGSAHGTFVPVERETSADTSTEYASSDSLFNDSLSDPLVDPQLIPAPQQDWNVVAGDDAFWDRLASEVQLVDSQTRDDQTWEARTQEGQTSERGEAATEDGTLMEAYLARDYLDIVEQAPRLLQTHPTKAAFWILLVRSLANLGRLVEADRACSAALERCTTSAELWYLHAILLEEAGYHTESAQAARRALYLDRDFVVAHLALGTALRKTGDLSQARRSITNALQIVERMPAGSLVPAADGETSERIAMAARVQLQLAAEVA